MEVNNENIVVDQADEWENLVPFESVETDGSDPGTSTDASDEVIPFADYDVYDGSISTTITTYFDGVVSKLGDVDYVLFRDTQYEYVFAYGDLIYDSSTFDGDGTVQIIRYNAGSYNSSTTVSYSSDSDFQLTTAGYPIYSNLGMYPELASHVRGVHFQALFLYLVVAGLVALIMGWMGYGLRKRGNPR